jgi:hypothetical protein
MKAMPSKLPYVNLFPNYANRQQLATDSYEAHCARTCNSSSCRT